MARLRRLVLVRHGETDGESSRRFHGSNDVDLSEEGRRHMREVAKRLHLEVALDLVVASPLRRSWRSAWIAGGGRPVRIETDFREIHFGRWEGLTREEIRTADPVLFEDWEARREGFEYPNGERRADFRARVERGLERLLAADARGALLVLHKGPIRTILDALVKDHGLAPERPELGEILGLSREPDGSWFLGRRSSNPPGLDERTEAV